MTWADVIEEDTRIRREFASRWSWRPRDVVPLARLVSDLVGRTSGAVIATLQEPPLARGEFRLSRHIRNTEDEFYTDIRNLHLEYT